MKSLTRLALFALFGPVFLAGCSGSNSGPEEKAGPDEAAIKANLAKLPPEDQKLAQAQKYCAINTDNRLGSMDVPIKVMVKDQMGKDQPVFLCCGGCKKKALADPDRTLATVEKLKAKAASEGAADTARSARSTEVSVMRVPDRGLQPQVAVDDKGVVHMVYFKGPEDAGDIFYVHSLKDADGLTRPIQVNSGAGSAIAVGNIRGADLALGKNGRVHVAWNGSGKAEPKARGGATPMLYTRLNDAETAFEPQRNLIQAAVILDGGGSVAADAAGNVYVAWHAPTPGERGEGNRCVWVAHSTDEGKTFAAEKRANADNTGACGCCGLRAFADSKGGLYVLYRGAREEVHRDMFLLASTDQGEHFRGEKLQDWEVNTCPMSSETFAQGSGGVVGAWETDGQVSYARIDQATGQRVATVAAPGDGRGRKHPAIAVNRRGEIALAWTEGMGWNKGGSVAWQVFDKDGKPTEAKGRADSVPTWSLVAVYTRPDGNFAVVY